MSDNPELTIQLQNFPPSGEEVQIRQLVLGPIGPTTLLLQTDYDEDTDNVNIALTLSNMCENDVIAQTFTEAIELLSQIRDTAQTQVDARLAEMANEGLTETEIEADRVAKEAREELGIEEQS